MSFRRPFFRSCECSSRTVSNDSKGGSQSLTLFDRKKSSSGLHRKRSDCSFWQIHKSLKMAARKSLRIAAKQSANKEPNEKPAVEIRPDVEAGHEKLDRQDEVEMRNQKSGVSSSPSSKRKGEDEDEGPVAADEQISPNKRQKLPVRVRDTGFVKGHRSLDIEIPFLSSPSRHKQSGEIQDSQDEEEVFKTPMEKKHIIFDDDLHEEFVTPMEAPPGDPFTHHAVGAAREAEASEVEEDSDDDAPPEAISSNAAATQTKRSAAAVSKAAGK